MRNITARVAIYSLVAIITLGFCAWSWEYLSQIGTIPWNALPVLIILFLVSRIAFAFAFASAAQAYSTRIYYKESIATDLASSFLNYLPMKSGMIARAVYLERSHNLRYKSFACILSATTLAQLFCASLLGVTLVGSALFLNETRHLEILGLAFALIICGVLLTIILSWRIGNWATSDGGRIQRWLLSAKDALSVLVQSPATLSKVFLWSFLGTLLIGMRLHLCFLLIEIEIDWRYSMLMAVAVIPLRIISFIPGALGLREFGIAGLSSAFGLVFQDGFVAAILDRLVVIIALLLVGPISIFCLSENLKSEVDSDKF